MVVDLSHCGDQTTMDGLDAAERPVIFTHASCRGLLPGYMRCKTDEAIRALARGGGVMGIPFIRFMIKEGPPVSVDDVVDLVALEREDLGKPAADLVEEDHATQRGVAIEAHDLRGGDPL